MLWYSCGPTVYDASHMGHARYFTRILCRFTYSLLSTIVRGYGVGMKSHETDYKLTEHGSTAIIKGYVNGLGVSLAWPDSIKESGQLPL